MKLTILGIIAIGFIAFAQQPTSTPPPAEPIKVRGCLTGNGSDQSPWILKGAVLPTPAGPRGGGPGGPGGPGAGAGAGGGAGRGGGAAAPGRGAPPAEGARGA